MSLDVSLDLRLPMGLMFSLFGAMLIGYGLVSDPAIYQRSLGININLWWGMVLLAFGVLMLALAIGGERKRKRLREATLAAGKPAA